MVSIPGIAVPDNPGPVPADPPICLACGSMVRPLLLRLPEAAAALAVSLTELKLLIRRGQLRTVHIDRMHRVPYAALVAYVRALAEGGAVNLAALPRRDGRRA